MAKDLAQKAAFQRQLGLFYAAWTSTEFMLDYAIGLLLKTPPQQTHLLTSAMEYGRKIRLLVHGLKESDHRNKSTIISCLNYFSGESKRNVFAHSFLISSANAVVFVERGHSTPYHVKAHSFTLDAFTTHVRTFIERSRQFREALDIDVTSQDFRALRAAALSLIRSDSRSHSSGTHPNSKT
jgi:hypothetical protein